MGVFEQPQQGKLRMSQSSISSRCETHKMARKRWAVSYPMHAPAMSAALCDVEVRVKFNNYLML
jgi:hypothetical protein